MCGIAGILGSSDPINASYMSSMMAVQAHRGPDGGKMIRLPNAWLGHRRLSVVDLNERANQPMMSGDGRYALVFNGEIYNYIELRKELVSLGYRFDTCSDSEVLLVSLVHWGESALDRLLGMFAFCFYDTATKQTLLGRDPFGQKPLHFARRPDGAFIFASEIKALLAGGIVAVPNKSAWARYLLDARYDDQEDCFFSGVNQLLPGELMRIESCGTVSRRRWYNLSDRVTPRDHVRVDEASEYLRSLLIDLAALHMRADVTVGLSLSGGLDSSSFLASLELGNGLPSSLDCFSVDFGGDLSEADWIERAAGYHGLNSTILGFTPQEFRDSLRPMMWHSEAPLGGLMNCALSRVMAAARQRGIIVLQDGTGLDEIFGGYRTHHDLYLGIAIQSQSSALDQILGDYCINWDVTAAQARKAGEAALRQPNTAIDGTVPIRPELLSDEIKAYVCTASKRPQMGDPFRDALASYLHAEKIPRNTRMKDRLSMAFGVELRLPFLDPRLVEFGLSLSPDLLYLHGRSKSILREALTGAMDETVRLARKRSIQAPQGLWLRQEPMKSYIGDLIHSRGFAERGFFDVKACHQAFARFCTGADLNSFFVWQWINVEEWFQTFIDQDGTQITYPLHQTGPDRVN